MKKVLLKDSLNSLNGRAVSNVKEWIQEVMYGNLDLSDSESMTDPWIEALFHIHVSDDKISWSCEMTYFKIGMPLNNWSYFWLLN